MSRLHLKKPQEEHSRYCFKSCSKRRGDTLIEVAIAIGIFSMVAIIVVSVISSATSGSQDSLEVTLTREELDSQAEALRFIHDSYVNGSQSADASENKYGDLWRDIISRASRNASGGLNLSVIPITCSEVFTSNGFVNETFGGDSSFVINTRRLGDPSDYDGIIASSHDPSVADTTGIFYAPSTYPRIVYGNRTGHRGEEENADNEDLLYQTSNDADTIQRVEGIYIVATSGSASIVNANGVSTNNTAYYDFYIRSCWMPPGADRASTISTVVRLYNPQVTN